MEETTKKAVEIFMEIYNKAGENINSDFVKSLRTRARNAPLLIATRGLLPYILFIASKAPEEDKNKTNWQIKLDNINLESTKGGYQAQLYAIAKFLQEENIIENTLGNSVKQFICSLYDLGDSCPKRYLLAEELTQEFTEHFKRLAEALLPSETQEKGE